MNCICGVDRARKYSDSDDGGEICARASGTSDYSLDASTQHLKLTDGQHPPSRKLRAVSQPIENSSNSSADSFTCSSPHHRCRHGNITCSSQTQSPSRFARRTSSWWNKRTRLNRLRRHLVSIASFGPFLRKQQGHRLKQAGVTSLGQGHASNDVIRTCKRRHSRGGHDGVLDEEHQVSPDLVQCCSQLHCHTNLPFSDCSSPKHKYSTQTSRSSQNRQLPPVPLSSSFTSSSISPLHCNLNSQSPTPNQRNQSNNATNQISLVKIDDQYDLLPETNHNTPFRNCHNCTCANNQSDSFLCNDVMLSMMDDVEDDETDDEEPNPFYSTIKKKQAACADCGAPSIYTVGESEDVLSIPDVLMDQRLYDATRASTPMSHLYSRICRPVAVPSHAPPQLSFKRVGTEESGDSGRLLVDELEGISRAGVAPLVCSEGQESSGGVLDDLMSISGESKAPCPPPQLPSRGYGRSELDFLFMLQGGDARNANLNSRPLSLDQDGLLNAALIDFLGTSEGGLYRTEAEMMVYGGVSRWLRRPSQHSQLSARNRVSQPNLGTCSDIPNIDSTLTTSHYRQNSYSDNQLANQQNANYMADDDLSTTDLNCQWTASSNQNSDKTESKNLNEVLQNATDISSSSDANDTINDVNNGNGICSRLGEVNLNETTAHLWQPESLMVSTITTGSTFSTVWVPSPTLTMVDKEGLAKRRNTKKADENKNPFELRLRIAPPIPRMNGRVVQQDSPSISDEMKLLRHMDSDLDLSSTPGGSTHALSHLGTDNAIVFRPQFAMTPLMERSMEGSMLEELLGSPSPRNSSQAPRSSPSCPSLVENPDNRASMSLSSEIAIDSSSSFCSPTATSLSSASPISPPPEDYSIANPLRMNNISTTISVLS